jgi:hypothetical protein
VAPAAAVTAPVEPAAGPALVGIARRSADDPAADRAYLAHSALVAPRGTVTFQARMPLAPGALGQINASLTDRISLGVGTMLFMEQEEGVFTFSGKVQLVRGRRAALAVALDMVTVSNEEERLFMPSLVGSYCADGDACSTLLSLHLTGLGMEEEDEMPLFGGASISIGKQHRLVGEIHISQREDEWERMTMFGGYLGGRFGGRKVAVDAGLAFAGVTETSTDCGECGDDTEAYPYPFVGVSARL